MKVQNNEHSLYDPEIDNIKNDTIRDIMRQFSRFYNSAERNHWTETIEMQVFVRKSRRCLSNEIISCIDIASVHVKKELRGSGLFTLFLNEIDSLKKTIYIENVFDKRFQDFIMRHGYIHETMKECIQPKCFYKMPR